MHIPINWTKTPSKVVSSYILQESNFLSICQHSIFLVASLHLFLDYDLFGGQGIIYLFTYINQFANYFLLEKFNINIIVNDDDYNKMWAVHLGSFWKQ